MNLRTAWIIASKDLKSIRKKKSILYGLILFPLLLAFLFPAVVILEERNGSGGIPTEVLPGLLDAFSFFFVIAAATLPTAIASYSIAGEKVEKSLEPLLATPTTDGEILLGKSIAAFLPPLLASYGGAVLYMVLIDNLTYSKIGFYYPNWHIGIILLLVIPLAEILSIESSVIASSRASDVRAANQLGGLMFIPFMIIYLASEIGLITLDNTTLLIISGALLLADAALFYFSTATFRREEILTKWK
jgi:ABC-2 type transport system permease protein